jgi:hypothetical protein
MLKTRYAKLANVFDADHGNYWSNLSRLNNLMVILNISIFSNRACGQGVLLHFHIPDMFGHSCSRRSDSEIS